MTPAPAGADDPRVTALIAMIGRTGAGSFQIRYSDDEDPVVWIAVSEHHGHHTAAGGMTPLEAVYRLAELLIDGGECQHCHRPTGVTLDHDDMPLDPLICWYQYDPELATYRRGCEGETATRPLLKSRKPPCLPA